MTNHRKSAATMFVTLGLACLTPVQQGATLVAVGAAALWAGPATAQQGSIPGVGVIIKKKPGNAPIIAPADANGEIRITGLEPGSYLVRLIEGAQQVPMMVGRDGRLALVAWGDDRSTASRAQARLMAKQISFDPAPSGIQILAIAGGPKNAIIDVNKADGAALSDGTAIASESGAIIVAERSKSGPFTDMIDFARRVCPQTAIDFDEASVKFGDQTMLVKRGGDPKSAGFKCARGTGEFELFGKKHKYVGHVTLLR